MQVVSFVPRSPSGPKGLPEALGVSQPPEHAYLYAPFLRPEWLNDARPWLFGAERLTLRLGLDIPATPGEVLVDLLDESRKPGRDIRLIRSTSSTFHPKVYAVRNAGETNMVVGSSNPSFAAFRTNIEANLAILGGSPSLLEDLEDLLTGDEQAARLRVWRLPDDPLPVVRPSFTRFSAGDPAVQATVISDGWAELPGLRTSDVIARFESPLSGLYDYADDTGKMAGIYIPKAERDLVLLALEAYGQRMNVSWRFLTREGATVFSLEEVDRQVVASGRGKGSHNLAITATRPTIARPATRLLRALGFRGKDRVAADYRIDTSGPVPRLWLIYVLTQPTRSISPVDVIT